MGEDKIRLQSRATEEYYEQMFRGDDGVGRKNQKSLCYLRRKSTICGKMRMEQRSGSSRRMKKEADSQDLLSFESCRSSAVDHVEEMSPEAPRKMQDEQEVMSETSGETVTLETEVLWNGVEGVRGYPDGEGHHGRGQVESSRREKTKRQRKKVKKLRARNEK